MKILHLGDSTLRQKALPIEKITEETEELIEKMFSAMEQKKGVGLAAPQVGVLIRLFIIAADDGIKRVFINPQIIGTSQETALYEEGCLSLPKVWQKIRRPTRVTVQARNQSGKLFTLEADGLLARAIQHEFDHLEGILFIDRCDPVIKQKIELQFAKQALKEEIKMQAKNASKGALV